MSSAVAVYMTTQGGEEGARAIARSDARLGVESTFNVPEGLRPEFIDFPFTDPDATFHDHLSVVKRWEPELTVAPDIEKGRSLEDVTLKADILDQFAGDVIVVPKTVRPSEVPDRFRVGVPVADFGSGAPWSVWEYRGVGPVHILGGGPWTQLEVGEYLPIASVDTATLGKRAKFGTWDRDEGAVDAPDDWGFGERLEHALNEYVAAWRERD